MMYIFRLFIIFFLFQSRKQRKMKEEIKNKNDGKMSMHIKRFQ